MNCCTLRGFCCAGTSVDVHTTYWFCHVLYSKSKLLGCLDSSSSGSAVKLKCWAGVCSCAHQCLCCSRVNRRERTPPSCPVWMLGEHRHPCTPSVLGAASGLVFGACCVCGLCSPTRERDPVCCRTVPVGAGGARRLRALWGRYRAVREA